MFINNFDPVAIQIFSIEIRWYSLAYIFGILLGWLYCKKLLIQDKNTSKLFDDLISYLIIGIILGGRLGYVIFYNAEYYLNNFFEILMIWQGGMSFHGGLIGVITATIIFCKKHNKNKFVFVVFLSVIMMLMTKSGTAIIFLYLLLISFDFCKRDFTDCEFL